ncbi:hypothetical protein EDB89DRAFT_2247245 [Lactarius sanguifluus]|nr:hypothetical protein EDB89DRAFT_2247245 [Lactarius sanguifluus]
MYPPTSHCPPLVHTSHLHLSPPQRVATTNPPRCPNTACKTFGPMPIRPCPNTPPTHRATPTRHATPRDPPHPFNATRNAPATTDPHATPTWCATPRHPPTHRHANTLPPPTRHVAPTWRARPRRPVTARQRVRPCRPATPLQRDTQRLSNHRPPRHSDMARNTPPPADSSPRRPSMCQDPAMSEEGQWGSVILTNILITQCLY